MSCSTISTTYPSTKLIARGLPEYDETTSVYNRTNDVVTDYWRTPKSTRPSDPPPTHPPPQQHSRNTRHTHSPSRTYFYHPSSVPSSPLSTSGVYTTPPSSAHLQAPPCYPFGGSVTHTSSVSSLTSGGVYAPPSPQPSSPLTSSLPYNQTSQHHHQQQTKHDRYSTQGLLPQSESVPRGNRSYYPRPDKQHQLNSDWRSESWSGYTNSGNSRQHSSTVYPLSQHKHFNNGSNSRVAVNELPSPYSEHHSDSSPPNSQGVSPYHVYHRSSPNPSAMYIDITCHPMDQAIELGDHIHLRCEARILYSHVTPTYQWFKDEEPMIGEVEPVFELPRTGREDLGYYFCLVSNTTDNSQRKSSTACVKIARGATPPIDGCVPFILDQPDSTVIVLLGGSLVLRLVVRAQPKPVFQWFKNGNEIRSSNTDELVIRCCTVSDEGTYVCSIKNEFGSVLTNSFKVYINRKRDPLEKRNSGNSVSSEHMQPVHTPPPSSPLSWRSMSPTKQTRPKINTIPDEIVKLATAQVCRQISPGDNIEGVRKGLNISVEDAEAIKLSYASLSDRVNELIYTWIRSNPYSTVAALENSLQVYGFRISLPSVSAPGCQYDPSTAQSPPIIKVHPSSVQVNEGDTVELSVKVEGHGITYQWYKDDLPYPGLIRPTVTLMDVQESISGVYHCMVQNIHGSVCSHTARVDVLPLILQLPPSLQGNYYRTPSHEGVGNVFSPPPCRTTQRSGGEPFSPEKKVHGSAKFNRERFNSSVSERLGNFRAENNSHRPVILEEPLSQELVFATELKLRILCSDKHGKLQYLWYFNGLALPSERQSEFIINSFTDEDVGDYSCEVSNEFGSVMSKKAHITLKPDKDEDL